MTDNNHPITPPRELMQQWIADSPKVPIAHGEYIATQAARWAFDQQRVRSSPESPLVERVADAIVEQATSAGIVNDRPARAAILQIAMWLREQGIPASDWVMRLEQEASA